MDAIEFSFRNIEAIRSQFYDVLTPIDQTLIEIERTKVAHLEAERKFEALTEGHERLRTEHAALTLDRNALAVRHEELFGARQGSRESERCGRSRRLGNQRRARGAKG